MSEKKDLPHREKKRTDNCNSKYLTTIEEITIYKFQILCYNLTILQFHGVPEIKKYVFKLV